MRASFLRAGAIYGLANALSAAVPFLLLPVLTRALPPQDYGVVVGFFLLVSVSTALAGLNVHSAVSVKWFDRSRPDFPAYVGSALVLALLSTVICAVLLLAVGSRWHGEFGVPLWHWPLAAVLAGVTVITGVRTTLWQSQSKALPSATFQVVTAAVNMALSLLAVVVLGFGADGRVMGASVTMVVAAVVAVALLLKFGDLRWACSKRDLSDLLRFGGPLLPHALAGAMLALADRFTVGAKLGPEALGIYGAAAQLGMLMNMLGDTLVKTASPWMYAQLSCRSARGRLRVVALTYLLIPAWLAVAVVLWLALSSVGSFVLGDRYQAAIGLSIWFLVGGALSSIYLSIAGLFFFTARNEWLSAATVSSALITVGLALVLVDRYGLIGAAVAYLVGQLSQLVLSWWLSLRVQPMPWQRPQLALRLLTRPTGGAGA